MTDNINKAPDKAVARDLETLEGRGENFSVYLIEAAYLGRSSGPIASEIARLTGERDAAREDYRSAEDAFETANHKLVAAEAETARLRAALEDAADALGWAGTALRELDAYAAAGVTRSAANNASAALTSQAQADV